MTSTRLQPLVFEPCQVHHVLQFCMRHPATSKHLIVCSSRDTFLRDLLHDFESEAQNNQHAALNLLLPTLSNLHSSRTIRLTFCPDLANLQAYLAALVYRARPDENLLTQGNSNKSHPLLMILNPIRLHESTACFSAQGFNRTFAAAVETAHHLSCQLIMVESKSRSCLHTDDTEVDEDMLLEDNPAIDPWDQNVSMLNITTKTFGTGERGWVGRSVKIGQVAERWCKFLSIDESGVDLS